MHQQSIELYILMPIVINSAIVHGDRCMHWSIASRLHSQSLCYCQISIISEEGHI